MIVQTNIKRKIFYNQLLVFFFHAEDGIRVPLWSRGLEDVYKKQILLRADCLFKKRVDWSVIILEHRTI